MAKEFSAEDYVVRAYDLLNAASIVASNLSFNAAGLNAGEEDLHREKLVKSIVLLKARVDAILNELVDEEDIERAKRELAKSAIESFLERFAKEG